MFRFLLGLVVGAVATANYIQRNSRGASSGRYVGGGVDELSSAERDVIADPELNVGDSTPPGRFNENVESVAPFPGDARSRSMP